MTKSRENIIGAALLGGVFYLISTAPSFAYLDPGSGSMLLTAILGVFAATSYTLKGYFHRATKLFRKDRPEINGQAGQQED